MQLKGITTTYCCFFKVPTRLVRRYISTPLVSRERVAPIMKLKVPEIINILENLAAFPSSIQKVEDLYFHTRLDYIFIFDN